MAGVSEQYETTKTGPRPIAAPAGARRTIIPTRLTRSSALARASRPNGASTAHSAPAAPRAMLVGSRCGDGPPRRSCPLIGGINPARLAGRPAPVATRGRRAPGLTLVPPRRARPFLAHPRAILGHLPGR
jgi:hypothetical protein